MLYRCIVKLYERILSADIKLIVIKKISLLIYLCDFPLERSHPNVVIKEECKMLTGVGMIPWILPEEMIWKWSIEEKKMHLLSAGIYWFLGNN